MNEKQVSEVIIGKKIPSFKLPATGNKLLALSDFKGKKLVLYFYPRDNTPGCTVESCTFEKMRSEFSKLNTEIIGVSRDSLKSHDRFREKHGLNFDLISDNEEVLCNIFNVMRVKNMYGKKVRGIERSTFLIDEKSKLVNEWRGVKIDGHVEEVLETVKALK